MGELMLASAGDDIKLWNTSAWNVVQQFNPHDQNVSACSWSFDGSKFGTVSSKDDKVAINFVKNNTLTSTELNCQVGSLCLDFSSNARFLLTGGSDSAVSVWNLQARKLKTSYKEHKGPVTCAQFNWNDSYIASGSDTGEIILHNFLTGQSSSPLVAPKVEAIRQLQYNYYKKSLLGSTSDDGAINLWDTNTRRLVHSFNKVHMAPTTGLAFSPVNEMFMLSCGLDQKLVCYDLQGKRILKVICAESPLTAIDVMNNGGIVAVGSTRGKIFIYDLRQGAGPVKIISAHKSSVQCLKFQPKFDLQKPETSASNSHNRRQLPSAPQKNIDTPFSSHQDKKPAGITSAAIVDVVSPLREGELTSSSRGDVTNRSHDDLLSSSSLSRDSGHGVFSPLSNNLVLSNSSDKSFPRRHNLSERGLSSMVYSPSHHQNQVSAETNGSPKNTEHAAPYMQEDNYHKTIPNGHTGLESPSGHVRSPGGISASPSLPSILVHLPTTSTSAGGAEGDVTDGRLAYNHVGGESPPRTAHSGGQITSPYQPGPAGSQHLRHLVRDALRDYSEQMQEELKTMFRKATQKPAAPTETNVFQTEFIRNMIREAVEDFRQEIHRDVQSLHLEMIRQFMCQQAEILAMLEQYSVNRDLVDEVERLREENKRLKKHF